MFNLMMGSYLKRDSGLCKLICIQQQNEQMLLAVKGKDQSAGGVW